VYTSPATKARKTANACAYRLFGNDANANHPGMLW
jgi:hypothetical protein